MWPMLSSANSWPGHQILWPPHNDVNPRSFFQQSSVFLFGGFHPLIGGLSGIESINWVSLFLNCSRSWIVFRWCGIAFHNIGPCTANELSNRVWFAAELDLLLGGTTARFPSLGRDTKETWRSLLVFPLSIFHMWSMMKRSRLRCKDISDKRDSRSQ